MTKLKAHYVAFSGYVCQQYKNKLLMTNYTHKYFCRGYSKAGFLDEELKYLNLWGCFNISMETKQRCEFAVFVCSIYGCFSTVIEKNAFNMVCLLGETVKGVALR